MKYSIFLKIIIIISISLQNADCQSDKSKAYYKTLLDATVEKIDKISSSVSEFDQLLQDGIQNYSAYLDNYEQGADAYFDAITLNARLNRKMYFSFVLKYKDLLSGVQKDKAKRKVRILMSREEPYFYELVNYFEYKKYMNEFLSEIDENILNKIKKEFLSKGLVQEKYMDELRKFSILINHQQPHLDETLVDFIINLYETAKKTESAILKENQLLFLTHKVIPNSIHFLDGSRAVQETFFLFNDDWTYLGKDNINDHLANPSISEAYFIFFIYPKLKNSFKTEYLELYKKEGVEALKIQISKSMEEDIWINN